MKHRWERTTSSASHNKACDPDHSQGTGLCNCATYLSILLLDLLSTFFHTVLASGNWPVRTGRTGFFAFLARDKRRRRRSSYSFPITSLLSFHGLVASFYQRPQFPTDIPLHTPSHSNFPDSPSPSSFCWGKGTTLSYRFLNSVHAEALLLNSLQLT